MKKTFSKKEIDAARKSVRLIMAHHLGQDNPKGAAKHAPLRIAQLGGGLTNLVFSVRDRRGNFVVRIGTDAEKISVFMKEQWAIAKAREKAVPTPEILQVGNEAAPVPYMISRESHGTEASFHPKRMSIVREMGRYAAVINSIRTTGFGSTFEWSHNQLSHNASWEEYLQNELKIEKRLETFAGCGVLDPARIRKLRTTLAGAAGKDRAPALNHGDLRLKNVLVDDAGKIVCILDWEHCTSNLAPEWELSLALHDLSIDEKQEFLAGYGMEGQEVASLAPVLKAMTVINYAPAVEQAAKAKNDAQLERLRSRLAGQLDLYSL